MGALMSRDSRVIHTSSLQLWGSASCVTHIVRICTPSLVHSLSYLCACISVRIFCYCSAVCAIWLLRTRLLRCHQGRQGRASLAHCATKTRRAIVATVKWPNSTVMNYEIRRFKSIKWKSWVSRRYFAHNPLFQKTDEINLNTNKKKYLRLFNSELRFQILKRINIWEKQSRNVTRLNLD